MMHHTDRTGMRSRLPLLLLAGVIGASGAMLTGCSEEPEEQVAAPPPPPKRVNPLEDLEMAYGVEFPEAQAPSTRALAEGVAKLASALIEGDADTMKTIVDDRDQKLLTDLLSTGTWESETKGIEIVRVCVLNENDDNATCELGLGIQTPDGAYMLAWKGLSAGEQWKFTGLAIEPIYAERVAMLDGRPLLPPFIPEPQVEEFVEIEGDGNDGIFGETPVSSTPGSPAPSSPSTPDSPFRKPD